MTGMSPVLSDYALSVVSELLGVNSMAAGMANFDTLSMQPVGAWYDRAGMISTGLGQYAGAVSSLGGAATATTEVRYLINTSIDKCRKITVTVDRIETVTVSVSEHAAAASSTAGRATFSGNSIRFSQSNVRNTLPDVVRSMQADGWIGNPIDVVQMGDGILTAVDNTRLAAAVLTDTPVPVIVRGFDEAIPAARAVGNLHGSRTWGEAMLNRIGGQRPGWRSRYPNGGYITGTHPSTIGLTIP